MKRRLQTVIFDKKIALTIKSSRQLITHKKIIVGGGIINSPSYVVPVDSEDKISLKLRKSKAEILTKPIIENSEDKNSEMQNG